MEINTDKKKIDEILERGVEEVIDKNELRKKLLSGRRLRVKLGIDPTSPNIHLGRSVPLLKLRDFQELGHKAVFIIGDFTGIIGDTSDKEAERPMLTPEDIKTNMKTYLSQAGKIINLRKTEKKYNSKWLKKLGYKEIGKQADVFSVSDFIARDNVKKRLNTGKRVSLREVLYPLMQGYDSIAVDADVELGGTDQRFNLLAGRRLQESYKQKPQDIIMTGLIMGTDGRKMSSSWGNTVNLDDAAENMYGKIMSMRDENIIPYFVFCTRVPMEEIKNMESSLASGAENPRDTKMKLARELTQMYHGEKKAKEAEREFIEAFQKGGTPEDVKEVRVKKDTPIIDILVENKFVSSKSEGRRLVEQGAIKNMDTGEKVLNSNMSLGKDTTLKIGKKVFVKIISGE